MCGLSSVAGETKQWCGTGWTGQPVVWERPDGVTEVIFGAYDYAVHFVNAATGEPTRPDFPTGDLIKGSVSLDPDGFPLLYFGSRDNKLRAVALDRDQPTELWSLDASAVNGRWNDDWDGNPAVVDDILFEGGENSWFFAVRLNRGYGGDGLVTVEPEVLVSIPAWSDELPVSGSTSIENSVVLHDDRAYFANGQGRVLGLDLTNVDDGEAPVVLDYWVGDDVDASLVVDTQGMLYVSVELERFNARSEEVGQLIKLNPFQPDDPFVWGVAVPPRGPGEGGIWATPALGDGYLYVSTHPGELLVVDTASGEVVWRDEIGFNAWSSPAIVDGTLIIATCSGELRGYSLADPAAPSLEWAAATASGACIESTPAVWKGQILVGSRDGFFYAFG
jgi:outer membrane protein assembly factor BamB